MAQDVADTTTAVLLALSRKIDKDKGIAPDVVLARAHVVSPNLHANRYTDQEAQKVLAYQESYGTFPSQFLPSRDTLDQHPKLTEAFGPVAVALVTGGIPEDSEHQVHALQFMAGSVEDDASKQGLFMNALMLICKTQFGMKLLTSALEWQTLPDSVRKAIAVALARTKAPRASRPTTPTHQLSPNEILSVFKDKGKEGAEREAENYDVLNWCNSHVITSLADQKSLSLALAYYINNRYDPKGNENPQDSFDDVTLALAKTVNRPTGLATGSHDEVNIVLSALVPSEASEDADQEAFAQASRAIIQHCAQLELEDDSGSKEDGSLLMRLWRLPNTGKQRGSTYSINLGLYWLSLGLQYVYDRQPEFVIELSSSFEAHKVCTMVERLLGYYRTNALSGPRPALLAHELLSLVVNDKTPKKDVDSGMLARVYELAMDASWVDFVGNYRPTTGKDNRSLSMICCSLEPKLTKIGSEPTQPTPVPSLG